MTSLSHVQAGKLEIINTALAVNGWRARNTFPAPQMSNLHAKNVTAVYREMETSVLGWSHQKARNRRIMVLIGFSML